MGIFSLFLGKEDVSPDEASWETNFTSSCFSDWEISSVPKLLVVGDFLRVPKLESLWPEFYLDSSILFWTFLGLSDVIRISGLGGFPKSYFILGIGVSRIDFKNSSGHDKSTSISSKFLLSKFIFWLRNCSISSMNFWLF